MLAITIVLFVVPHNQQIVTIRQFFTYRISLFRNQNLNILNKPKSAAWVFLEYIKIDRDKSTFKSHRDFDSEIEMTFKHF